MDNDEFRSSPAGPGLSLLEQSSGSPFRSGRSTARPSTGQGPSPSRNTATNKICIAQSNFWSGRSRLWWRQTTRTATPFPRKPNTTPL